MKATLTLGIPAFNEERNILNMLSSVLKQKQNSFKLEKIIVISDGSSDKTELIVKHLIKKYPIVKLIADERRLGKAKRLNQLYELNKSDFLGTFDGDIILKQNNTLELMIQAIIKDNKINVVAANQVPAPAKTMMGKFAVASFNMFYEAAKQFRDGNNIHCLQGSASIMRKKFAKSLKMQEETTADQGLLYVNAIKKDRVGFKFVKDTKVVFNAVSTFRDWKVLGYRTIITDKQTMAKIFGRKILKEYQLPKTLIYKSIWESFQKDPLSTIGSVIMNLYIRKFPDTTFQVHTLGIWEIVSSSKEAIGL